MRKGAACTFLAVLLLLFALPDARAQAKLGAHLGIDSWRFRPVAGADARIDLTELAGQANSPFGLVLNPTLEYRYIWGYGGLGLVTSAIDWDGHAYQLNGNVLLKPKDVGPENAELYAGVGLMLSRVSYSNSIMVPNLNVSDDDSDTTFGLNLLGGVNLQVNDSFTPFVQARLTLSPQTEFELYEEDPLPSFFETEGTTIPFSTRDATSLTIAIGVLFGS